MTALRLFSSFALGLALWQAAVSLTGVPRFLLPPPMDVLDELWSSRALLAEHASITLLEILLGLVLGLALGLTTAILLTISRRARDLGLPLIVFTQTIPVFAIAPLLTLWFGYGIGSKIVMAMIIIYFPVTSTFHDGLMRTPGGYLDLAASMGARKREILWRIRIPAALPSLGSALRLTAVYTPLGVVISEWVGASRGLGYLILLANGRVKTDQMFACLIILAAITIALHAAMDRLARYLELRAQGRVFKA